MDIKKECKYLIASPTSMGVRLVPTTRTTIQEADLFQLTTTSAESNVLNIASSLGHKTLAITKFVKNSPILEYFDSYRCENISANLLQTQRDYFGAHTYEVKDIDGQFHTNWY